MKIVVNTRLLRKDQMDGIGWFTYNTLKKITKENPDIEFHFLFDSGIDKRFLFSENIIPHNLFPPAKHALLNIMWFEWSVKKVLKKIEPDLFLSPDGILCLGWKGKQYSVIHDLNFVHIPEVLKYSNRKYYNYFFPRYTKKADRIGTVSEYSRQDIINTYKTNGERIDVLYNGINSFYHPVDSNIKIQTRNKYTQGEDYFVFIGTLSPRKNILALMKAFEIYKSITNKATRLIIAGSGMYKTNELVAYKSEMLFGKDVIFTGRLTDRDLNDVLASALSLVFVPLFEGFGIPVIEAMQCDVPVIASNVTSLPEIISDAGLLVNPENIHEIAGAMIKIDEEKTLRKELIQKGRIRKTFFSWDKTSDLLWDSVKKIL